MPKRDESDLLLAGFQLWANLPTSHKMMDPRYRDLRNEEIPLVDEGDTIKVKIICGEYHGVKGPVQDIVTEPEYLDVFIAPNSEFNHIIPQGHNAFAYVIEGEGSFDPYEDRYIKQEHLVIYEDGEEVLIKTRENAVRFLLISGKPINEPVAWRGPIVMNTEEELRIAFQEYQNGTFIKHK